MKPRHRRKRNQNASDPYLVSNAQPLHSTTTPYSPGPESPPNHANHGGQADCPDHYLSASLNASGLDDILLPDSPSGRLYADSIVTAFSPGPDPNPTTLSVGSLFCDFSYGPAEEDETAETPWAGEDEPPPISDSSSSADAASTTSGALVPRASPYGGSRNPDLAMIAPLPANSPKLEFCIPAFSEFSDCTQRRALLAHFCNVLSHLIVLREESGNPFQQLVLPLTHSSPPVLNAIYALASAHLEFRCAQRGHKPLYFHNKAIQGLAKLIDQGANANRNELLACIMLLVYYEVVCDL